MQPTTDFAYDVFLSHSSKDAAIVRSLADRMHADGLRVWYDEWEIRPGDSIPAKIERGLEQSRVLVLCMSENAFGSDWANLEAGTFRFRDPLNEDRRFIPLRTDHSPIKGSLAQLMYIDWASTDKESAYLKLLDACRPTKDEKSAREQAAEGSTRLSVEYDIRAYAFNVNGDRLITGDDFGNIQLWNVAKTNRKKKVLEGRHVGPVWCVAWSADQRYALSGGKDSAIRLWDLDSGKCLGVFSGHGDGVTRIVWSADNQQFISASGDGTIRLWDIEAEDFRVIGEHNVWLAGLDWSLDQRLVLSGGADGSARVWEIITGKCLKELSGHTGAITCMAWSKDSRQALSSGDDNTVRLWDVNTGRCLRVLEGHTKRVHFVAWSPNELQAISASADATLRLWDVKTGNCLRVLKGHDRAVRTALWTSIPNIILSADNNANIRIWDVSEVLTPQPSPTSNLASASGQSQVQYTNAKVLLVGESGSGKTGLSKRLALNQWEPSDSTVGAWATHWKLPLSVEEKGDTIEREIWLWDFGGQADQRLIHQLYMNDTALAALVFDGQKEDLFETLGQWDRDLTRASSRQFAKLLVAGRVDTGGLRVSRRDVEEFAKERNYSCYIETSAKVGTGCKELKEAIVNAINWKDIPWRSSPLLFKRIKDEIVHLKDEGRVLMRVNELRETLQLRLSGEDARFTDDELKAVVGLLAGPGVVWELKFGNWVLLQPERINAYAQAVIQTMRTDKDERGCISEERVLNGGLTYQSSAERLGADEERFVLLAMHQTLLERGLCLREHTDHGALLIFPSYYRRERPELEGHPAVLVSYRFNGFLDDIYATLVVRLHHTDSFEQDRLWRYAADFKTLTGKQLGVMLNRRAEGAGELELYFDPTIPIEEKIIFSKYVHEHLLQNAKSVIRLRHYVCPHCGTPVANREIAMKKLDEGKKDVLCVNCDDPGKRVPLWDEMEELFASADIKLRVLNLQKKSAIVLDSESKERALVGDVISTVALAGQISRELTVSDHGIDMEIEFKSDAGQATGRKVYLQLKSGDSYLTSRKKDGAKIFAIQKPRHADYWREQAFPVLLLIRNSDGITNWMDVREYLQRENKAPGEASRQIVFAGQRFDVMSVRKWRDLALMITA